MTKEKSKQRLSSVFLILATFFLPLGFDALFALIMKWTGSYWITDVIFYCISGLFFGLYFIFSGNNPISILRDIILSIYEDKIKHYYSKLKNKYEN